MTPLPYAEIPEYPDQYNEYTILARMIDGLGFRYYWATEGLTPEDLDYRVTPESRSTGETVEHIYKLAQVVNKVADKQTILVSSDTLNRSFEELRKETLEMLWQASELLKNNASGPMDSLKIVFQRGDQSSEFPIWNLLNGQLADALWHCGQLVAFRRASGNPIDSRVNVFRGKRMNE